jgi:hypothetical protein
MTLVTRGFGRLKLMRIKLKIELTEKNAVPLTTVYENYEQPKNGFQVMNVIIAKVNDCTYTRRNRYMSG